MKIAAVSDRANKKDFVDLFFLNKNGINLDESLKHYDEKFHLLEGNLYHIVTSLSYFEDVRESNMPPMLQKVSWEEIEKFFEQESLRLAKKYLN